MTRINGRRVLGGGLFAGLILLIAQGAAEQILLAPELDRLIDRLGLARPGEEVMVFYMLGGAVIGIIAVWLYAMLREFHGAGARTALRAGAAVWALACLVPNVGMLAFGILTPAFFWLASVTDLVAVSLATTVGAWVYRAPAAAGDRVDAAAPV